MTDKETLTQADVAKEPAPSVDLLQLLEGGFLDEVAAIATQLQELARSARDKSMVATPGARGIAVQRLKQLEKLAGTTAEAIRNPNPDAKP